MKNIKKYIYALIAAMLFPVATMAQDVFYPDASYATIEDAIAALGDGGTLTLTDDVSLTNPLDVVLGTKSVTFDLNGKTISGRTNLKSGNLTIKNGNIAGGSNQALNVYGSDDATAANYSVLTINSDVNVTADVYGVCMFGKNAQSNGYGAVINIQGNVITTGDGTEGAVFVSGNLGKNVAGDMNNVINITGKVTSATDAAVALNGNATVNIQSGAEITGYTAIAIKRGVLNVNGGTITATGAKNYPPTANHNGTEMTGAGISMSNTYNQYGSMAVNITDGVVNSKFADALYKAPATYANDAVYAVSGGEFSSRVPADFIASGYICPTEENNDGNFYITTGSYVAKVGDYGYETFEKAVEAAGNDGVITLLGNITDTYTMTIGQTLKIAKNGKTITIEAPEGYGIRTNDITVDGQDVTVYALAKNIAALVNTSLSSDYTGVEQSAPLVIVDGDYTLQKGVDYKLKDDGGTDVDDIKATDVGPVNFTVEGIGKYIGSQNVTWTIFYNISKEPIVITVDPAVYNGSDFDPVVHVKNGDADLEIGTHYTVSYSNTPYLDAKTYVNAITITGVLSQYYRGTVVTDFIVQPCNVNDLTAVATVPWTSAGYADGAAVMASTDFVWTVKNKGVLISKTNFDCTVLDLKDDANNTIPYPGVGTYPDQVVITPKSDNTNFTGSLTVPLVITAGDAIDINNCVVTSYVIYTSQAQPPSGGRLIVTYLNPSTNEKRTLKKDVDYVLTFNGAIDDYKDAKTYSNAVTLKGIGDFYGSLTTDYVISPRELTEKYVKAEPVDPLVWNGHAQKLNVNDQISGRDDNNVILKLVIKEAVPATDTDPEQPEEAYFLSSAKDYTYTTIPTEMKEPGEYQVTFVGRYNFTGEKTVKVMLLKDINLLTADDVVIPVQVLKPSLYPSNIQGMVVKDGDKVLERGIHYSLKFIDKDGGEHTDANTPVTEDGKLTAVLTGKEPYYNNEKSKNFIAVNEYYPYGGTQLSGNTVGIHITSGADLTANVGKKLSAESIADPNTDVLTLDNSVVVTVPGDTTATFTIVGIDDNTFVKNTKLKAIDATALENFVPSSLSRTSDAPFNGIAKQALVYLNGNDIIGENYVYQVAPNDFRCELFKIYDDVNGNQTGFSGEDYAWQMNNLHAFKAYTLTNTRQLNAGQHYTTCLPYALPVQNMKVYTLDAASNQLLGFKEVIASTLEEKTPYVIIPEASGQLLSTTDVMVPATTADDGGELNAKKTGTENFELVGSLVYRTGDDIPGAYIMQSGNEWKQLQSGAEYDGACVLPMRAYIKAIAGGGAKPYLAAKFFDVNGNITEKNVNFDDTDWSNAEVYDLQGRKVNTDNGNLRRGVYIVNGKKAAVK
jgi:hypothetical protein